MTNGNVVTKGNAVTEGNTLTNGNAVPNSNAFTVYNYTCLYAWREPPASLLTGDASHPGYSPGSPPRHSSGTWVMSNS